MLISGKQYIKESLLCDRNLQLVIGCDEAGRGPLAGPVVAGAVILPQGFSHTKLDDSKKMSQKNRDLLRTIIENEAVAWGVGFVSAQEIDRMNILRASIKAMHRATDALLISFKGQKENDCTSFARGIVLDHDISLELQRGFQPEDCYMLIDGNRFMPYGSIPFSTVVKGDAKVMEIAAASVLAKTHRDEYMRKIALEYPKYGWDRNMAYPTAEHREAIIKYGLTPYHRRSFSLCQEELPLF